MGDFAWVTLATNDSYSLGALVLAHSLKQAGTIQQLAVLITPGVTDPMREKLRTVFNVVQEVNILDSRDEANLRLLKRPELGVTFTKLHCWRLTQYKKCVFLDADTLVLQNCDELFEREELSAAPDVGWPDCFNSGVFVYRPSNDTFDKLIQFALDKGSFDGGDQGLLNLYFSDWAHKDISKHLPFIYNMCSTACYSYLPAYKQFGSNAKIIHFIGATKPWLQYFNTETRKVQPSGDSGHLQDVLQRWWDIFCSLIHPQLSPNMPEGRSQQHYSNPPTSYPHYNSPTQSTQQSSSASDFQNEYDPWDEYDRKQSEISQNNSQICTSPQESPSSHNSSHAQSNESPNTSASFVAEHHNITHSQPQTHDSNLHTTHTDNNYYYHQTQSEVHYHPLENIHRQYSHNDSHEHHQPNNEQQHIHQVPQYNYELIESHNECFLHHPQPYSENIPQEHSINHNVHHTDTHFHDPPSSQEQNQQYHEDNTHNDHPNSSFSNETQTKSPCPSPKRVPSPIPVLPCECKATDIVSNDVILAHSTEEIDIIDENAGLAGAFARLTLGVARTPEQDAFESILRKQAWEVGNIDYLGKDSFDNIWSKISETLAAAPAEVQVVTESETPKKSSTEVPEKTTSTVLPVSDEITKAETPKVEVPVEPAVTETIVSPPVQSSEPLRQKELLKEEVSVVTAVLPAEIPPQTSQLEDFKNAGFLPSKPVELFNLQSEPTLEGKDKEVNKEQELQNASQTFAEPETTPRTEEKTQYESETKEPLEILKCERTDVVSKESELVPEYQKSKTESVEPQPIAPQVPESDITSIEPLPQGKSETKLPSPPEEASTREKSKAPAERKSDAKVVLSSVEPPSPQVSQSQVTESSVESTAQEISKTEVLQTLPPIESKTPEVPQSKITESSSHTPQEVSKTEPPQSPSPVECQKPVESTPQETYKTDVPRSSVEPKVSQYSPPTEPESSEVPRPKITEPTPPLSPSTPPTAAVPQLETVKQALIVESNIPATPPPSSSQDTPTPPPRKEGKPKKGTAKPKK